MRGAALVVAMGVAASTGCGVVADLSSDYVGAATDASVLDLHDALADALLAQDGGGVADVAAGLDSASGDAGADAIDGASASRCNVGNNGGSPMVEVPILGGGTFCIDATEVTQAQYSLFVSASGAPAQGDPCQWNKSYTPGGDAPSGCQGYALNAASNPVACVDWCDAKAYCAAVAKRLCGKIGGGDVDFNVDPAVVDKDQWFAACTSNDPAGHVYPYGATYSGGKCVDTTIGSAVVGSHTGCRGGSSSPFDMSGNVAEWEDACDTAGGTDMQPCHARGGDYNTTGIDVGLRCATITDTPQRKQPSPRRGFRCCKD